MKHAQTAGLLLALAVATSACAGDEAASISAEGPVVRESRSLVVFDSSTLVAEFEVGVIPHIPNDIERVADGRVGAVFGSSSEPLWFDSDGVTESRIGELGEGPGEFGFPWVLLPVPDSVVVFDQLGRVTVVPLDGGTPRTIHGTSLRIRDAAVVRWPDRIATTGGVRGRADSVAAISFFDASGSALKELGVLETRQNQDISDVQLSERILATGQSSDFWAADRYDYRVVHRSASGEVMDSVHRAPSWAPDGEIGFGGGPAIPPTPRMVDLTVADDGRVWTLIHVAHPDWAQAWEDAGITSLGNESRPASSMPRHSDLYQARIEVFSADLDTLLVSEVAPGFVFDLLTGGYVARYSESDVGEPILDVLSVRVGQRD